MGPVDFIRSLFSGVRSPSPELEFSNRRGFEKALRKCGLHALAKEIAAEGRPALVLAQADTNEAQRTKLGGVPDLPDEMDWPIREGYSRTDHKGDLVSTQYLHAPDGVSVEDYHFRPQPLDFIAQVDLAEMAGPITLEAKLPQAGMLYFFYDAIATRWGFDPRDAPGFRVLFYDGSGALRSTAAPRKATAECDFPEVRLAPRGGFSIPSARRLAELLPNITNEMCHAYDDAAIETFRPHQPATYLNQLVGLPSEIQNPMEYECALVTSGIYLGDPAYHTPEAKIILAQKTDWQLLLQIDSDDDANMMWGDLGLLYWWIRRSDLEARDFSKVWLILQCS